MFDSETQRLRFVEERDGKEAALAFAKQTLQSYRKAAQTQKHFAHCMPFRPHFVASLIVLRKYIITSKENK